MASEVFRIQVLKMVGGGADATCPEGGKNPVQGVSDTRKGVHSKDTMGKREVIVKLEWGRGRVRVLRPHA